jgi:hypothetical protein
MHNDPRRILVSRIRAPKRIGYVSGVIRLSLLTDYGWVERLVGGRLRVRKEESTKIEFGILN